MKSRLASFFFAGLLAFSSALQVSPVQADVRNDIDAKVRNTVVEPEESAQPVPEGTASSSPEASAGAEASATPSVEPSASASASPSASPSSEPSASASASPSASPSSEPSASPEASSEPQAGESASASASPSVPLIQRAARADTASASATPEAVSANDHLVHDFDAQVFYGGTKQDDGKYVWSARSHAAGHRFSYRVSFGLGDEESGDDMVFAPGTIRITVPVTVLKDRNGEPADKYEMSVPSMAEVKESEESGTPLDNDISFAYEEQVDSDNNRVIVITNIRDIYPGFEGFIEMSYLTTEETFAYRDMEASSEFTATITAMDPSTVTDTDNPDGTWTTPQTKTVDGVYIDTQVALQGMSQRAPAQYDEWQKAWGDDNKPADDGSYSYFVYELDSVIGDNSQEYAMSIDDEITSLIVTKDNGAIVQEIEPGPDTGFAAAWFDAKGAYKIGQRSDLDGTGNPNGKYDKESGHRYDYVVLAFKKTLITEANKLEITTRTTATVHPRDDDADGSQATSQTFERRFVWNKPVFRGYGGGFGGWVRADGFYRYQAGRDEWPREYFTELGNHASNYSAYNLNDLIEKNNSISGLDYAIWTEGYVGSWSIDRNAKNPRPDDYFKEPVRYEMTDNQFYLSDENDGVSQDEKDRLTSSDDYQIDRLRFNVYAYDSVFDDSRKEFVNAGKVTYGDDEVLTFYVQIGRTDAEFVKAADYQLKTNTFTNIDNNLVKATDTTIYGGPEIDFKDNVNVVGYRFETKNTHYYTRIGVVPSVTLKASDRVKRKFSHDKTKPTESFALNNRTVTTIYDYKDEDGNVLAPGSDGEYQHAVWGPAIAQDADFIRKVEKVGSLTKDIVASTNLQKKKEYRVTWKIHADESYIYGQNEKGYAEQNGGTFYDLLPIGAVLDPDSIVISTNDGELASSSYSVQTISTNYNDTGRSFVKISVYDPADWYDLYYDTVHTYESIRDYGNEAYNSVAFQTGNDSIEGFYQDPSNPTKGKLRSYFDLYLSDVKENKDDKKKDEIKKLYGAVAEETGVAEPDKDAHFLFRGRDGDIEAITAAASGLTKRILSSRSNRYDTTAIVDNNSEYSYRLRFQNSYSSSSENIILYDDLENYQKDGRGSDWKGTLKAIDFSALPKDKSGNDLISPVVYYSTENQNFDGKTAPDLSNWTKLEPGKDGAIPEDLQKEIHAIAIDLSKAADGTAYTLGKGEAVSVNLTMAAPEGAKRDVGYPETYNGVLISYDRITDSSRRHQVSMEGCTVGQLVISRDVNIKKLSNRDHTPIRGIQFRLYGKSGYGTEVDKILSTDRNGELTFTKVEKGTYTLMEYGSNPEWLDDHTAYTVEIDSDGKLRITNPKAAENNKTLEYARAKNETDHPFWFEIENTPRIHGDLSFYKARQTTKDNDALIGIPDTTFELAGTSDYGNDIVKTAISDKNGLVKIQNIEKGTYTLREIKANEDYILNEDKYQVVVNDAGTVTLYKPVRDQADPYKLADNIGGQPVIFNTPAYWDVSFLKVDKDLPTRTLEGAEFTVTGASLKQPVTVSSNANGRVTFHHLKAGSYVLKETKAPTGLNGEGKKPEAGKEAEGVLNYTADPSEYLLTINNNDGTFTITKDGKETLSKNTNGDYLFPNERALDGQITIIKKWDDASDNDHRPTPVIHLETSENQEKYTGARVVVEWLNDYASARPSAEGGVTVTIVDGDGKEVVSSSKATSTSGNLWFYNFPDQELNSAQTYYVYETQPVSIVDNGKYTGSAVGAENKIQLVHGKATISNTYKETHDFSYTGDVQTFTASHPGYYRLEVWGASGGFDGVSTDRTDYDTYVNNHWDRPGLGGYSYGSYYMNKGETVYVIVGEQGHDHTLGGTKPSYNGGGRTTAWSGVRGDSSGGGMTHISTQENVADASSNSDWDPDGTIIVAGGGGGIDNYGNQDEGARGGDGGGTTGGNAWANNQKCEGTGGGTNGKYKKQGVGENYTGGASDCGGGGGGWYGGASSWNNNGGAGGGSGYVSDVLENAETIAGSEEVPNPNGGKEIGHFGNGFARITFISSDSPTVSDNTAAGSTQTASNTSTYETTADGWTKVDDNTWKYVMPVFDDTATYTYWEDVLDGYTSDAPAKKEDAEAKKSVINGSENKTLVVTNTAKDKYGSITVSKKVVDTNGNELTTSTQDFTFTLTLTDKDRNQLSGTQVIGDQVFTNGSVTFTLHEGESKRFDNVPIGMNYEVSETSNKNYTTTSVDSGKGLVSGDSSVEFTNTYTLAPKSRTEVTLEKKAEGSVAGSEKDAYPFHAHLTGLDANLEFSVVIGSDDTDTTVQKYMSNAQGEADVTLSLKSGQKAVFKNIPVGATYRFVEDAGQWTARFKAANATADGTIARTSGENTSENQELATETETVEEGEKTTVTFINTLAFTQQLTVKKTVQHEDGEQINPNEKFEVTVTVTGLKPGARIDTDSVGILTADDTGMAVKTFNIKDQQSVVFRNVPVSATYQVKETGNDYIGSYRIYSGKDEIASGENKAANEDLNTREQTMVKDQDPTVELISGNRWVKVAFRKEAEDGTKLHGANFTLYKGTGDSRAEYKMNHDGLPVSDSSASAVISLGEKTLTLASGTYELVETKAPRGYLITDDTATITFNVNEKGVELEKTDKAGVMVSIEKEDGKDPVIVIKNKAGTRLPSTGGMDVRILLAAAVAMIGTALFGFWKLKKEEKH